MKKHTNNVKSLRKNKAILSVLVIALVGFSLLMISRASGFSVSVEPEQSTKSGVSTLTDATASNGQAIQFSTAANAGLKCSQLTNLKFCDDFDGAAGTYPDSTKWNVFTSGSSWGSQCWKKTPENISMDGQGNLKQTLIDTGTTQCTNSYGSSSSITSGGMDTKGKFTTKYGKFEIRAKLSCAASVWGAIWLSTGTGPGWPQSGEIDIYELGYNKYGRLQQTVWFPNISSPTTAKSLATYVDLPTGQKWCDDYHVYGVDWRENSIQFTVDGQPKAKITPANLPTGTSWPFNSYDLRLLIDLQYGQAGRWTGDPDPTQLPSSMLIDYVRIYN